VAVNAGLAHLSDTLFTTSIGLYSLALISYCGEYAFGRRGRVARTAVAPQRVLVGAGVAAGGSGSGLGDDPAAVGAGAGAGAAVPVGSVGPGAGSRWRVGRAELAGRLAVLLTVLGAAGHLTSIVLRGTAVDRIPWGNMYEFTSAVGFVAVAAFCVVLLRQPRIRYLGMFVMLPVIVLMFLAGTVLYAKAAPLVPALRSYWLAIHVTAAITATGIFLVSFVATLLYLIRARYDRLTAAGATSLRFPTSLGSRLPEAGVLDQVAYRTVAFGFPVWTFAIAAGAMWAEAAWGRYWGWDPKETWSFIAWVIYAAYLHARATAGWKGVKAARINLLAYGAMTFNFFVVNIVVAGLHSYAGLS
jgi:cytochrome c-type biogenesis protein CcsB